jgi:hypothetical protein
VDRDRNRDRGWWEDRENRRGRDNDRDSRAEPLAFLSSRGFIQPASG